MSGTLDIKQKYGVFLEPIKDLTKNWNVDIDSLMQKLQGDLEKMTLTFEDGNEISFAQAAMIIQGTASVWSHKVDFLEKLTQETETMLKRSEDPKKSGEGKKSKNKNGEVYLFNDGFEEDLLVVDNLPTANVFTKKIPKLDEDKLLPRIPPFILTTERANRGRRLINVESEDTPVYSNDFWEAHYIPFEKEVGTFDFGVMYKMFIDRMPVLPDEALEENPINEAQMDERPADDVDDGDPPDMEPNIHDDLAVMDDDCPGGVDDNEDSVHEEGPVHEMRRRFDDRLSTLEEPAAVPRPPPTLPRLLDPYEDFKHSEWPVKPFRRVKTFKTPDSINSSRKRKMGPDSKKPIPPIYCFMSGRKYDPEEDPSEEHEWHILAQHKEEERKKNNKIWKELLGSWNNKVEEEVEEERQEEEEELEPDVFEEEDDDDIQPEFPDMNTLRDAIENMPNAASGGADCSTYEDLVRHHVEAFYSSSQRYFQDTEMSRRLKVWEEEVKHRLEEQAGRPQFDIYKYMDKILEAFDDVNQTKSFEEVVGSIKSWEICRMFVAALQLTNDNNVHIEQGNNSLQSISLTLLSRERRRERFDEYAPQT